MADALRVAGITIHVDRWERAACVQKLRQLFEDLLEKNEFDSGRVVTGLVDVLLEQVAPLLQAKRRFSARWIDDRGKVFFPVAISVQKRQVAWGLFGTQHSPCSFQTATHRGNFFSKFILPRLSCKTSQPKREDASLAQPLAHDPPRCRKALSTRLT